MPLRWDAAAAVGVTDRIMTGRPAGSPAPWPGPMAEIQAHVALLPMIRLGAYVEGDLSPASGIPARQAIEGGVRVRVTPPLLRDPWRVWAFVGVGYAREYAPGHGLERPPGGLVAGAAGGILDLPVGLGLGVRLRGPWFAFAELGGRVGLAFTGTAYDPAWAGYLGRDSFAAALSLGVSLQE